MCQELSFAGNYRGVPVVADANAINHSPQLFQVQPADQPSCAVNIIQTNWKIGGRKQVAVDGELRDKNIVNSRDGASRNHDRRLAESARNRRAPALVDQRELFKLGKFQDVVLENSILLPWRQSGLLQVGGHRLQDLDAAGHIQADLFADLTRNIEVGLDPCLLRTRSQGIHRYRAVSKERHDRRG